MALIQIGSRTLGGVAPTYVIAEVGINHDGSLPRALEMIDVAAQCGADCVKFQMFRASAMYQRKAGTYRTASGEMVDIYNVVEQMEMPVAWVPELIQRCAARGVDFLTTVCDTGLVSVLDPFQLSAYKVASYEISHLPLFHELGRRGKPIFFSCGGSLLGDIEEALEAIQQGGGAPSVLMHCVAKYPTPLENCNLDVINTLKLAFPGCVIGYSDHSEDPVAAPAQAVALGAKVIEKHFTLDKSLPGPDHSFAVDPTGLRNMVAAIREVDAKLRRGEVPPPDPLLLGGSARTVQELEVSLRKFAFRTLFATQDIKVGEPLTPGNVGILRAGGGLPGLHPRYFDLITTGNHSVNRHIAVNSPITWEAILFPSVASNAN